MNNSAPTPGPWIAATSQPSIFGWPVVAQKGKLICDVTAAPPGFPDAETINAEALANARLIAVAPELLEALELAERFMRGFEDDELQEGVNAQLLTIRCIIAKARGQYRQSAGAVMSQWIERFVDQCLLVSGSLSLAILAAHYAFHGVAL